MAELILTEAEKNSGSYLDWDDASLGMAVKALALKICDERGEESLSMTACATMLACSVPEDAAGLSFRLDDVTEGDKSFGNFDILVTRID